MGSGKVEMTRVAATAQLVYRKFISNSSTSYRQRVGEGLKDSGFKLWGKLLCFPFLLFWPGQSHSEFISLKEGDIIFQTSQSSQSKAIQLATKSKYSHMGIIYKSGDKFFVYEAIQPVKLTPLDSWIKRGQGGNYVVKRLKDASRLLNEKTLKEIKRAGKKYKGRSYDLYFEWSDNRIYCSELVWKIFKEALGIEIGKLQKFREFDFSDPVVKAKLKERFGNKFPLDEPVISPQAIFESDALETVTSD